MIKRLRVKMIGIVMGIVTVMLCIILGMVIYITRVNLETESIQRMQRMAADPFHSAVSGEHIKEKEFPWFRIEIGPYGQVMASGSSYYDLKDEEFLLELLRLSDKQSGVLEGYNLRYCRVSLPVGQVWMFVDISGEQAVLHSLVKTSIMIGILSFLIFLLLSVFFAYWAVRPVEKAWKQQKQFVADASHELKTPLTVILTNAELLQDPTYDEKSRLQFTDSILSMACQMRHLVETLLNLAKVDNGSSRMIFSDVDFSGLIHDSILPFEALYFERKLMLEVQIEEGIRVYGNASYLQQVADILLDNAAKYSLESGTVTVCLKKQGRYCLFAVSNPGEAISQEDLKNIFKRFYQLDASRGVNHGYGLGLSIAESIIQEHKGKIWAESEQGIHTFSVRLPVLS